LKKSIIGLSSVIVFSMLLSIPLVLAVPPPQAHGPPGHIDEPEAVIYVTSQGKYYHTIVPYASDGLPWNGNNDASFQQLFPDNPISSTPYGPGDPGYRGGRWWIDSNSNGYQDAEDTYFLCPLLGPGRDSP
jgi:hypothetical protein